MRTILFLLFATQGDTFRRRPALPEFARQLEIGSEPVFAIAIKHICPIDKVLDLLKACSDAFPGTQFNLFMESGWGALDRLRQHDADICISFEDGMEPALESEPWCDITMVQVRAPSFQPDMKMSTVPMELALRCPQVIVRDSSAHRSGGSYALFQHDGRQWLVNDFATKKQILLSGLAWGRMPLHQIEAEITCGRLVPFQIEGIPRQQRVSMKAIRWRNETLGPVAERVWDSLRRMDV